MRSGGGRRGVPWCREAMAAAHGLADARGSLGYNRAWQSRTTASMGAAQASLPAALACCDGLEYRSPVWIGAVRWSTTPGSCDRALSWATCFASKATTASLLPRQAACRGVSPDFDLNKASAPRSKSTSTTAACPAKAAACRGVVAPAVSQTFASSPASSNNSAHFGAPAMAAWWSAVRPPLLFESWTRAAPRCKSSSTHPSQPAAAARWRGGLKCANRAAPSGSPPASRASFRWCASAACAWKWTAVSVARRVGATTQRDAVAGLWALRWAAIRLRDLVVLSTDSTFVWQPQPSAIAN